MEPQLGAGDVVVLGPRTNLLGLAHYLGPDLPQARWTPAGAPPMPLASALWNPVAEPVRLSDADIAEALRQGRRVWLVLNPQDSADFLRQAGALLPGTTPRLDRSHPMLTLLTWGRPS
jgi:hypothetical protein